MLGSLQQTKKQKAQYLCTSVIKVVAIAYENSTVDCIHVSKSVVGLTEVEHWNQYLLKSGRSEHYPMDCFVFIRLGSVHEPLEVHSVGKGAHSEWSSFVSPLKPKGLAKAG